jgi:hypothetical protein
MVIHHDDLSRQLPAGFALLFCFGKNIRFGGFITVGEKKEE